MPTETAEQWDHIAGRRAQRSRGPRRLHRVPARRQGGRQGCRHPPGDDRDGAGPRHAAEDGFFAKLAADAQTADGPLPEDLRQARRRRCRRRVPPTAGWPASWNPNCCPPPRRRTPSAANATPWRPASFLGAAVDLEETYAWGVQELDRLIAEQEARGRADPARRQRSTKPRRS